MPIEAPSYGEDPSPGEPTRTWRPSGRPEHLLDRSSRVAGGRIVERSSSRGWLRRLADLLKLPLVKVVIGVSLFILAAIVYDATINGGSWTERPPKAKATQKVTRAPAR